MQKNSIEKMTDEELAASASLGDAEAGGLLMQRYKDAVRSKAGLYFMLGADRDDIVQEGMIGLFNAVRTFDAGKNTSFATYADRCISNQIISAVRAAGRKKHSPLNSAVSLQQPGRGEDGEALADILAAGSDADPEAAAVLAEAEAAIFGEDSRLFSGFERKVFSALCEGESYSEIAAATGRSPKSVDNAVQRIRRKLRPLLG